MQVSKKNIGEILVEFRGNFRSGTEIKNPSTCSDDKLKSNSRVLKLD